MDTDDLRARLAGLRAQRDRLDQEIQELQTALRVMSGEVPEKVPLTRQIVAVLRHAEDPLDRKQIAAALSLDPADVDRLSRLLTHLSKGPNPRIARSSDGTGWTATS